MSLPASSSARLGSANRSKRRYDRLTTVVGQAVDGARYSGPRTDRGIQHHHRRNGAVRPGANGSFTVERLAPNSACAHLWFVQGTIILPGAAH